MSAPAVTHIPRTGRRWALALKLTLAMALLLAAVVAGVTFLSVSREERVFRAELERQAELLIRALAASATYPFYNLDRDFLSDMVSVIGKEPQVVSARVYDVKGRVVADAHDHGIAPSMSGDAFGERLVSTNATVLEWQPDRLLAGRVVVAGDRRMGAVSIGLSRAPLEAKVSALRSEGFAAGLLAVALGMILALFISRSITSPLQELTRATQRVAAGDLTQKIVIRTRDEIAVLAEGFNSMIGQLREIMAGLEQRIHERTHQLTERERELREAKVFLEDLITASPMVFFQADTRDYTVNYISANVARVIGFAPHEVLGIPHFWLEHTHPADREQLREALAQMRDGEPAVQMEHRLLHKDGSARWVLSVMRLEGGGAARPLALFGYALDITERKRAEEALQASEEAFRATSEAASEAIISSDIGGRVTYFNTAAERIFGYTASEAIGRPITALTPRKSYRAYRRNAREILTTGESSLIGRTTEHVGMRKDGTEFPIEVSLAKWKTAQGVFFTAIIRDITERKQAEEGIHHAREEAIRANKAKSEFLSRMSHELRTPLNAVLGFAQLLDMDELSPEHREGVKHILRGGQHLLELINEVLDIARIETGRLAVSPEPVLVREIALQSVELVAPIAGESQVRLVPNLDKVPDVFVMADRQRLKQVLLNLLVNAVKYNRVGGSVTLGYQENAEVLRVNITDTGHGIAPERMQQLFTPFERLGAEHTNIEGTGLGLALSKHLVDAMEGTLGVQSTESVGSTFWVELPLTRAPAESLVRVQGTPSVESAASTQPRLVLFIEEYLSNLALIRSLLARHPHVRLLPAAEGRVGLDLARAHRPDAILLDTHVPDMSVEEVFAELRAAPETRHIPVIVIGSESSTRRIQALLAAGVRGYMCRPMDVRKFLELLDEALREPVVDGTDGIAWAGRTLRSSTHS